MNLRVFFLSFVLTFGLFFSSVGFIQAALPEGSGVLRGIFSRVPEIQELISARDQESQNSSELSVQTTSSVVTLNTLAVLGTEIFKAENGAIPELGNAISMMYDKPPASGEVYVADLLYNLKVGPAQPAYAQVGGLGFAALEPVLYAWKQFRNIAYLFFIVITLIIGFMIMMRQKVGSQAAVTAQQAIPQIIIALITVTFSYAIAGFMIDMMYVIMFLFMNLFVNVEGVDGLINKNLVTIAGDLFVGGWDIPQTAVQELISAQLDGTQTGLGWISGLAFSVIIAFAYLFAMIALFFELLKTYIAIVVSIVLSPLLLMLGALPGKSDVFKDWVMGIVANLVAFPVFLLLVILHKLMTTNTALEGGFLPPFLMGRSSVGAISSLIGLAIMLIAKDLVAQAKKSFNPKGTGIFEIFGQALSSSISKGWKGGELIPGVGMTDTNKLPYLGSGKSVTQTGSSLLGAGIGAGGGALRGLYRVGKYGETRRDLGERTMQGARLGGRSVADLTGSETFNTNRAERQKTSIFTDRDKFRKLSNKEGK
ncbi:MAG: hypothetical protein GW942_00425 [Candidatus Pacebacteria bacterium]|nr:hypothetical protein [Candidatus Paceibacterota bacterium]